LWYDHIAEAWYFVHAHGRSEMDCFVKVSADGKAVISRAVGVLNTASYQLMRSKIVESVKNSNAKQILVDMRQAVVSASVIEIYHVATASIEMFPAGFRYAIVYSDKTITEENARFGETVARNRGALVKIFRDLSDAKKWLAIPEMENV